MLGLLIGTLLNAPAPQTFTVTVDGVERTALVYVPAKSEGAPVVFAYHGHGGNERNAARSFRFHTIWPEAVSVYSLGLPTKTPNDRQGNRNGWDAFSKPDQNKDIKFFDALYEKVMKETKADKKKVFVMGHSNGASFTYGLWQYRGDKIAAVGPCAAPGGLRQTSPKPAFIEMGETDPIVNVDQQHASIEAVLKLNGCGSPTKVSEYVTSYKGKQPVMTYIYPGGHNIPQDTTALMVDFFKKIAK